MSRTALTKTVAPGPFPAAGTAVTFNAGDNSNNNFFFFTGGELIIARNDHATDDKTIGLISVADAQGRTGDITDTITALTEFLIYGPFNDLDGWRQAGGKFNINPESSDVKIAVISLGA